MCREPTRTTARQSPSGRPGTSTSRRRAAPVQAVARRQLTHDRGSRPFPGGVPALDFETALRPIATIAAFVYRHADDSADQALHGQADTFVFAGQCRKRTAGAPDDDAAV